MPTPRGRHHHRCSLERVPGNGATRPQAASVLLSVPSVCLPTPLLPTLSGWNLCPLHWGQRGMGHVRDMGDVGDVGHAGDMGDPLWGWW